MSNDDLGRFVGYWARLWHFSPSHDRLALRLSSKVPEQTVFLVLSGCDDIRLPISWKLVSPLVKEGPAPWIELIDESVSIRCRDLSIHDSYPSE
jgi:hypothetical protein